MATLILSLLLAGIVDCSLNPAKETPSGSQNGTGNPRQEARSLSDLSFSILSLSSAGNSSNVSSQSPQVGISSGVSLEPKLEYTSPYGVPWETNAKLQVGTDTTCDCKGLPMTWNTEELSGPKLDLSSEVAPTLEETWTIQAFGSAILDDLQPRSALSGDYNDLLADSLQDQLRQFVIGVPLDIAFSTLNFICSSIVDLGVVRSKIVPDMARMAFLLRTEHECRNTSIPLERAEELFDAPGFDPGRPSVLFITGWKSSINNSNSGPVAKAYGCRNDTNILVLDAANFVDTLYTWSALNTEAIGAYVAQALLRLDAAYVTEQLHIVGHSLGAQIAGSAGRNYRQMSGGRILRRVTGLDPANPCFYDGNDLEGLRSGDARFVDIIHSNPGILGSPKRAGDADFFVQGRIPFKAGCSGLDTISCSHQRAVDYYAESVYPSNEQDFLGRRCDRYAELLLGRYCRDSRTVMGYAASPTELGLFYVGANGEEPYGQNANPETYTESDSECGYCD